MELPEKKIFLPEPVPAPLLEAARALRKNMTDAEQALWLCLRRKQLGGYRFRRQHPFDRYVLDFFCTEARLGVELDGGQHNRPEIRELDRERTMFLQAHGIRIVRFWNDEVFRNLDGVLQAIYTALQEPEACRRDGRQHHANGALISDSKTDHPSSVTNP